MSMTIKEAIRRIRNYIGFLYGTKEPQEDICEAMNMAITALREKEARENPAPLTIEELRQINGEPLWLTGFEWRVCYGTSTFRGSEYIETGMGSGIPLDGYGEFWFAYRYKPKEEHHEN